MKILHTGDFHLGAYVGPQCDDPMKRMENTTKCLDTLVETARQEQPDIILVAGDIFHSARTWNDRAMQEYRVAIDYLSALGRVAPVMVLLGTLNHDPIQSFYALEEHFMGSKYPFVRFFTQPAIIKFDCKSGPIQIAGLPGFDKGHFRAQFPGLSAEEENQVFTQQLAQVVQGLSAQVDPAIPSVLMAHHTVVGCELDNGTHVFQANEVVLDRATLDNSSFDLVCLGHIHRAQCIGEPSRKPIFYSGSIDAFTFNDEEHIKGFWIHDTDYPGSGHKFVWTSAREFMTERWDSKIIEIYQKEGLITRCIDEDEYKDKVVRVLYTCDSETEKAFDKKKLERDLYAAGAYYVSEIRPESITASVNRDKMHEKLTVWDCLRRYLTEKKIGNMADILSTADDIVSTAEASSPIGATSGLFLPVEIEVRNYRSYAEEKLSFEDIFFAMVNGKNGAGKSSLFMDAITDCLYEETREKELTGWIRNGEKSGSISFTFRLGGDTWRVTRTRQRSGKATLALAKQEGNFDFDKGIIGEEDIVYKWADHSAERLNDTQQKIIDLLGMDCDTFQSCVLIMQDRYGKFMEASKEDRMSVLANLLGLGIYDELEKLSKDKLTEANRQIRSIKAEIEKLDNDVKFEISLNVEKDQVDAELALASDNLQVAREELTRYQGQLATMDSYVREAAEIEKDLQVKTDSCNEKKSRKVDLERRVTETKSFLQNEQHILDKCAELDSSRLEIAALDGKVQLLNDKRNQCDKVNRELLSAKQQRKSIASKLEFINMNLQNKDELEAFVSLNTSEADLEQQELNAQQYNEANNEALRLQMEKTNVERSGQAEIREMEQRLEMLKRKALMLSDANCIDIENAKCRFLKDAIEAKAEANELETKLIAKRAAVENDIENASNHLQEALNKRNAIKYYSFEHEEVIRSVKQYRDAKDRLAKMAADAATADALRGQDAELVLKITSYEQEINLLSSEIAELEKLTGKVAELNSRILELKSYEASKQELPKAKQFIESTNEVIAQLDEDIIELCIAIGKADKRLAELNRLTTSRPELKTIITFTETKISALDHQISGLNQQIGTINAKLETIVGQKLQLIEKQENLQQLAKQASQLQVLVEAFSQDGIPYQIIRDIVPELESAANEILGQMTGGRMRLEFITEKVLKSNKTKEIATLEIIIIDVDNGTLPYLSRSGGQKVRCALANSFALAMIKASRVGLQLGMLFIDEPSFLDADGIEGYCAALETIHNRYPDMRILAISHDENMKSRFPQQLYVDVTENGSKVKRI